MAEYKVWAYARSAVPNLPALENQLEEVMRESDRRGYIIIGSCVEQGRGNELWRPALFAMLKAVRQKRVEAVIVESLDRISHDIIFPTLSEYALEDETKQITQGKPAMLTVGR